MMDALGVILLVAAINWLSPLLLWFYPLTMLLTKDFAFKGFYGPWAKFKLAKIGLLPRHAKLWRGWTGVGLYGFLCYRDLPHPYSPTMDRVVRHEAAHCRQWALLGLSFYFFYTGHMAWIWLTQKIKGKPYSRHPYFDCWAERRARRAAGQRVVIRPEDWPGGEEDLWPWW